MNKVLKKLRYRSIKSCFKQFVSVIFIVLLSTMLLSGFITNSYTLKSCVDNYFEKTNMADVWVNVDKISAKDESFFKDNNLKYDKRLYFESASEITTLQINSSAKIYVYQGKLSTPYIESGKWGCVIDKNVAKNHNIRAGFDDIAFSYSFDFKGETVTLDFKNRLTGTMCLDENANSDTSWVVFIEESVFIQSLTDKLKEKFNDYQDSDFKGLNYNQILIKTDDVDGVSELIKTYYQSGESDGKLIYLFDRNSIESVRFLNEEVKQSKRMIYVFPVIFFIVAILIILTTIDQLVIQEKKHIGILKACGVQNKKILKHYSKYGSILCLIGALAGSILGVVIIPEIMFARYADVYSIPDDFIKLKIPFSLIILMVIGVVVLGYAVSYSRCYNMLYKTPIECLKKQVIVPARKLKGKLRFKKMPIYLKMATRNIKVKMIRTVMASIGVAGCVALLMAGFGMTDTVKKSVNNDFKNLFNYDINSTYKNDDFIETLKNDSRTEYFEQYSKFYVEATANNVSESVYVYQIEPQSQMMNLNLNKGEICVSESIADSLDVKVGDEVIIRVFDKTIKLKISKLVGTTMANAIYVCDDLAVDEFLLTKGVFVRCNGNVNEFASFLNSINGTNSALTIGQEKNIAFEKVLATTTMTKTIKIFAVFLSIIVLLNLILLILKERNIELATLKVMGLNSWQVSLSVFAEVVIISIFGVMLGLLFGYPLMLLILSINKIKILNFVYCIKFLSILATISIVVLTILVMLVLCYFKIRKVNMAESLKFVE